MTSLDSESQLQAIVEADLSWYESSARQRIERLLDADSFMEFIGPQERQMSVHLDMFELPRQFDDGMIVGRGLLEGAPVLVAAQEGRFMGGAIGEVHGAKLTGLLRAARELQTQPVLILFDTGGVRLQEANAGELAIAEIMRAVVEARHAGVTVLGLLGGRAGCYGGGSLIAGCCSALAISEPGRLSVSGPEVIETNRGIEEFDSKDRAMVWRNMGGKHRRLLGGVQAFVEDSMEAFRQAALELLLLAQPLNLGTLEREQVRLAERLQRYGDCADAGDIWRTMGISDPDQIPGMSATQFISQADRISEGRYDAR
jgi:malonate decarboxylase beta subunit